MFVGYDNASNSHTYETYGNNKLITNEGVCNNGYLMNGKSLNKNISTKLYTFTEKLNTLYTNSNATDIMALVSVQLPVDLTLIQQFSTLSINGNVFKISYFENIATCSCTVKIPPQQSLQIDVAKYDGSINGTAHVTFVSYI